MSATSPAGEAESPSAMQGFFQRYLTDPDTKLTEVTNSVREVLDEHFGTDTLGLPMSGETYKNFMVICYQLALDEWLDEPGREKRIVGVRCPSVPDYGMPNMTLGRVLCKPNYAFAPPVLSPPEYVDVACGVNETHPCIRRGLVLVRDADGPSAIWIRPGDWGKVIVEVMALNVEHTDKIIDRMREGAARLAPFRGQVVRIDQTIIGPAFTYLDRPRETSRDDVILPEGLLDQIERHSLGVVKAHDALLDGGRHLKRGILLHGPPGTGKTHTIKYLSGQVPDCTVAIMSAGRMYGLDVFREVIDMILPAVIVLDDVDLIAEDRAMGFYREALFQLLDLLDGIREDADLLFVMTTNRPNEIEPAVAARPGRIDQAVEVPLPDASCRERLFDLYAEGLDLQMSGDEKASMVDRTEGVTAAFIREMLRRATVESLRSSKAGAKGPKVTGAQIHNALDALLDPESPITPLLLGSKPRHAVPTISVAAPSGASAK